MATLYNSDLKPLASGEYTHYYDHATKLFLADNFRLTPKQKFLYYVCINIDQSAVQGLLPGFGGNDPASSQTLIEQYETGLMAKRVDLPRFNIQTRTLKAYNRKNIFQTGISYEPLNITFHDDAADTVTKFWNDFYTYYYRDSDYDAQLYTVPHKYSPRRSDGWGFQPRNNNLKPFLRNIQIFSLHNKRFTEYLLINPVITAWRHGDHDSAESNGLMEATMTVEFETVKYRTGFVNPVDVNGFAVIHYDNTPSPISNSVTNIFSDAGLVGALTEGSQDLYRPDGSGSGAGILGSVLGAYRFYNNLKNTDFKQLAKITLGQVGAQILGGVVNGVADRVFFPTSSGSSGYGASYGGSQVAQAISQVFGNPTAQTTYGSQISISGQASAQILGAGISIAGGVANEYIRGIQTPGSAPANPGSTALYSVVQNNNNIKIGADGQPTSTEFTAFILDGASGQPITQFQTVGTQSGTFDPTNPGVNVKYIQESSDQNGQIIRKYQYRDETVVWFNEAGDVIRTAPGTGINPNNINTNPVNTRDEVSQGKLTSPTQPQYYTDPVTGITRVVNGGTSGLVRNTLSGTAGSITGLAVGSKLYGGLNKAFGGGVISQTVAAGISGIASTAVGVGVNNLVQSGLDYFLGTPGQSFNPVTGKIQNVVSSQVGTGGFTSSNPSRNVIDYIVNGDGTRTYSTIDGGSSVVNISDNSIVSSIKGAYGDFTNWLGSLGQNNDASVLLPDPGISIVRDGFNNPIYGGFNDYVYSGGIPDSTSKYFIDGQMDFDALTAYDAVDLGPSYDTTFNYNPDGFLE